MAAAQQRSRVAGAVATRRAEGYARHRIWLGGAGGSTSLALSAPQGCTVRDFVMF